MKNTIINKVTVAAALVMASIPAFALPAAPIQVAEPGSIALLGAGIAAIVVSRYFKSRNK
jgi:hypothetical protein